MRALMISDLRAILRVLRLAEERKRVGLCRKILWEAEVADRFTRRLGRVHPAWGSGTLLGAAAAYPMADEGAWSRGELAILCGALAEGLARPEDG